MMKLLPYLLALSAALPAGAMSTDRPNDQVPDSVKGKRITFFFEGCRCLADVEPNEAMQEVEPGVTLRFVNFNYGNTSNGKNGGSITYSVTPIADGAQSVVLSDSKYSGSGYRVKGNPKGDSGEWHLYFEGADYGSAWFMGTENGVTTYYEDVAFAITPVAQSATPKAGRSRRPATPPEPGKAGEAPESMEDMVITLLPRADQPIEQQEWALVQIEFGRDYVTDGRRVNHIVAVRGFGQDEWHRGTWVNAFLGETEQCLYPGYLDYCKQADGTARIQLSGECTANAYYTLSFDSPTTGTLTYHHEDEEGGGLVVVSHIEGIPFKVTHKDYTSTAAPARGESPESDLNRSFKAED